jgi:hypothetical protein
MRRLVNDLLLLAQSDTARVIAQAPVRLDALVEQTLGMAARQTHDHPMHATIEGALVVFGELPSSIELFP